MNYDNRHTCDVCNKKSTFVLEWYGVNQLGENPEVADERGACRDFSHLVELAHHGSYGNPEGIVDYETLEIEHPELLEALKDALATKDQSRLTEIIAQGQAIIDSIPIPGQLELFAESHW